MRKDAMPVTLPPRKRPLTQGDRVRVLGAGRDWLGTVTARAMPDGSRSIHPRLDDTAIYVTFDETGVSAPVSVNQVQKVSGRAR